jgi:uncharacterized LabA/DUF88 family protein
MKKVGVFIDVQNIYLTTKANFGDGKINFTRLREFFLQDRDAKVTFTAFTCYDESNDEQMGFLNALGLLGFRVVAKPIRHIQPGNIVKANMDLDMAIEVLAVAPHLDEIVLVTGDSDFRALVDFLARSGKYVRVVGPDRFSSPELIQAAHEFINLHRIEGIRDF